jgi:hypothetical protein
MNAAKAFAMKASGAVMADCRRCCLPVATQATARVFNPNGSDEQKAHRGLAVLPYFIFRLHRWRSRMLLRMTLMLS